MNGNIRKIASIRKIRIETFERKDWLGRYRFYFRLRTDKNRETIAPSEAYNHRQSRDHTAELLRDNLADAYIVQVPK